MGSTPPEKFQQKKFGKHFDSYEQVGGMGDMPLVVMKEDCLVTLTLLKSSLICVCILDIQGN